MRASAIAIVLVLNVACMSGAGDGASQQKPRLTIQKNSVTDFDAVLNQGNQWARVVVRYTPETTFYSLTTSEHTILAFAGTEPGDPTQFNSDPRSEPASGYIQISRVDPEFSIVTQLHQALLAAGVTSHPSPVEQGTTLYAAGYTTARVLGLVPLDAAAEEIMATGATVPWPHPGFNDMSLMPPQLRAIGGDQSFVNAHCCGPYNCDGCNYVNQACDDWCAAGDNCNTYHHGNCGSKCPGLFVCPHTDSPAINAFNHGPCNTNPKSYCLHYAGYACRAQP
jgi:hypothetical protein